MVEVKRVQSLYFSPTGTTRRVIEAITDNIGLEKIDPVDLTIPSNREKWNGQTPGDLVIVGIPTYYDTIPSAILSDLNKLEGNGKWAVAVAVYGNVSCAGCLEELTGLLRHRGFKILAAANFVGEHSFTTKDLPLAAGRPDADDLGKAMDFGRKIGLKIKVGLIEAPFEGTPLKVGSDYTRKPEDYPENGVRDIAKVEFDEAKCSHCLDCVNACPNSAIDADTLAVNDVLCTRCFACTRVCPTGAFRAVVVKDVNDYLITLSEKRQEPRILL